MTRCGVRAALVVLCIAATLGVPSCSADSDAAAKETAVDYLVAADAGDQEQYCDLSVDGRQDRAKCLENAPAANDAPGLVIRPKVVNTQQWDSTGQAVLVEVLLQAGDGEPRYKVVGVTELDGDWLVKQTSDYLDSPPDEGTIADELQ